MPVFTANVPGTLRVGDRIEIGGKIKENARKMSINLCAQEGEEPPDVVLHFDVRFHRDNIISLSRKNGVWIGSGNYDTNYNMFVPGTIFRIIFEVKDSDVITIYCQGKFHSNFLPKIPMSMAKYLVAWADVERISHCYFHIGKPQHTGDASIPRVYSTPRHTVTATAFAGDRRFRQKLREAIIESSDSSEDSDVSPSHKPESRASKFIYDTLTCKSPERCRKEPTQFGSTADFSRKLPNEAEPDFSSNNQSLESEFVPELDFKKKNKRNKFHFGQVASFVGRNARKS